jgi:hypothetical protein
LLVGLLLLLVVVVLRLLLLVLLLLLLLLLLRSGDWFSGVVNHGLPLSLPRYITAAVCCTCVVQRHVAHGALLTRLILETLNNTTTQPMCWHTYRLCAFSVQLGLKKGQRVQNAAPINWNQRKQS